MNAGDATFVDSNVLLYYIDPANADKRARATEWLDELWASGRGRLSWQVLHEFYWNAIRKMHLDSGRARELVGLLSQWKPVETSFGLIQHAWRWMDEAQLSYWDALILSAAERSGARYLLSEDFQNGRRYGDVEVVSPFERSTAELL